MNIHELVFMIVEDDDLQREMLRGALQTLGAKIVYEASGGLQALQLLRGDTHKDVHVVLCDLNMPEMDGMEFLRHIGDKHASLSAIIISALDDALISSVTKMAKGYGINLLGALEKPVSINRLENILSAYRFPQNQIRKNESTSAMFSLKEILYGVNKNQFTPYYQPKIDVATGNIVGMEALARWIHPDQGVVSPYAFISTLEESGHIDELTFLILDKAVGACKALHDAGYKINVSINLSLSSLSDVALADKISVIVQNKNLEPKFVILEITESAAMTEEAPALENLARLRMRGFGLSIDDYGTGYSSMQQITRVAFTELKIDRSFVKDVNVNKSLRIVVSSSIDLASRLKMKSTAEGVETSHDLDALRIMGCDIAQGFFIAKPMDLISLTKFCETN